MKVICFGDSNTWGYDPRSFLGDRYDRPWPEYLGELTGWEIRNNGSCGREIPRRAVAFPENAALIIVMLGTNDLLQGATAEQAGERMAGFLATLDRERILLLAPPTMAPGEWTKEALIRESQKLGRVYGDLAETLGVRFLDATPWAIPMAYDGVHFTAEGHSILAKQLMEEITL